MSDIRSIIIIIIILYSYTKLPGCRSKDFLNSQYVITVFYLLLKAKFFK